MVLIPRKPPPAIARAPSAFSFDPVPPPSSGELACISCQPIVFPLKYSKCAVSVLNLIDPGSQSDGLLAVSPCGGTKKCVPEYVVIPDMVGPPVLFSFDKLLTLTSYIYC